MSPFEGWTLAVALLSLAVAGWGAWLASRANATAERSLTTSNEANAISRDAARAAVSALPIEFKVRPVQVSTRNEPAKFVGVELRNDGAAIFVHSLRLEGYGVISPDGVGAAIHDPVTDRSLPIEFTISHQYQMYAPGHPISDGLVPELPFRMHKGEVVNFRLPEPMTPGDLSSLEVRVGYSLGGEREEGSRHVHGSVVSYRERHSWEWTQP